MVNEKQSNNKIKKNHMIITRREVLGGVAGLQTAKACRLTMRELNTR